MANSEEVDLMSLGNHCSIKDCRRLDFLPFECKYCHEVFCIEHERSVNHNCPSVAERDIKVPICPLCQSKIVKEKDQDVNIAVERHISSGCQTLIMMKRKKNKCSIKGCRQVTLIPFACENCHAGFCVRHRHPMDHNCLSLTSQRSISVH